LTIPRWLKDPAEIDTASRTTGYSTHSMNPHLLWLSIDNPSHHIVHDFGQLFECRMGIDHGFIFSSIGPACVADRKRVGIPSFLGIERIRYSYNRSLHTYMCLALDRRGTTHRRRLSTYHH